MRLPALVIVVVVLALAAAAPAGAAPPALSVSGNALIDAATGARFVPRGVNWPSFEYACYYGYGYANERAAHSVGPDDEDAANIASWHANTVRLPLNQDCWLGDDGLPAFGTVAGYRAAVKRWVALLHRHGLAVVLDLHWSGPDGVPADGQRAMADARSDDFWASVASAFRADRAVMFDLFNEPAPRWKGDVLAFDLTWRCWLRGGCRAPATNDAQRLDRRTFRVVGMQALVRAVRRAGARQPILLGGRNYANDLRGWLESRPAEDQLVASFHSYPGQGCDNTACRDAQVAPVAARVPVVATEIGEDDCRAGHVTRLIDWATRHDVGYLAWEWILPDGPVTCGQSSAYSLIADARGTPRRPLGAALQRRLAAAAASDRLGFRASTAWLTGP